MLKPLKKGCLEQNWQPQLFLRKGKKYLYQQTPMMESNGHDVPPEGPGGERKHPLCMTFAKTSYSISSQKAVIRQIQVTEHSRGQLAASSKIASVGLPWWSSAQGSTFQSRVQSLVRDPRSHTLWYVTKKKKKVLMPALCGAERTKSMERGCGEYSRLKSPKRHDH